MSGDLARGGAGRRLVAEEQRADGERLAPSRRGRPAGGLGIVVAGDPEPVAARHQRGKAGAERLGQARRAPPSWKLSPRLTTIFGR